MDEKQHEASDQQRQRFRDKGEIARSQDVVRVGLMAGGVAAMISLGEMSSRALIDGTAGFLGDLSAPIEGGLLTKMVHMFMLAAGPTIIGSALFAIALGLVQSGGHINWKAVGFKPEKLNPLPKLMEMFASVDTLINVAMSSLKVGLLAVVLFSTLYFELPALLGNGYSALSFSLSHSASLLKSIVFRGGMVMVVLAVLDYGVNKYRHEKKIRMSDQEVKDESKEQMGDPLVRQQRKRRARELVEQRSVKDVPTSDVVVVNPTHYAVALKYDTQKMGAPRVMAKGADAMAAKIREVARKNGVPIVSNPPLARVLYRQVKIGRDVPGELYQAVALVLAYIYRIRRSRA
jgi:flagellar biosynthesis protein FlhB